VIKKMIKSRKKIQVFFEIKLKNKPCKSTFYFSCYIETIRSSTTNDKTHKIYSFFLLKQKNL